MSNRGVGNRGLVLRGGMSYEGYIFARAATPITLTVALHDISARAVKVLASTQLQIEGDDKWSRYNFSFTPNASTTCTAIPFGSDPTISCSNGLTPLLDDAASEQRSTYSGPWRPEPGDVCQRCGGEVAFGLTEPGSVNLDFAALHPGDWGRFAGLEVRRDAVELLQTMGITAMRQGGSFSDPAVRTGITFGSGRLSLVARSDLEFKRA